MGAQSLRTRSTTFAWNPGSIKFFEFLSQDGCTDMRKDQPNRYWPTAVNPVAERDYLDLGDVVFTGGPNELVVGKNTTMWIDPAGRDHPPGTANVHFNPMGAGDAPMYLAEKTTMDVKFTGSPEVPEQTFEDVLFMPQAFEPTGPHACAPGGACPPIALVANTPTTFTCSTPPVTPPMSRYPVVDRVTGADKGPAAICIEPNDGEMTMPAELVNAARAYYPTGGVFARQTLTHTVRELVDANGPTGRRIDFLTIWCYASRFTVTP